MGVKSTKWVKQLVEGQELEFVFDPNLHSVYVAVSHEKVAGHCHLKTITSVGNPYGGNIKKKDGVFRTDEQSGHYGAKWHDSIRFKLIELMSLELIVKVGDEVVFPTVAYPLVIPTALI